MQPTMNQYDQNYESIRSNVNQYNEQRNFYHLNLFSKYVSTKEEKKFFYYSFQRLNQIEEISKNFGVGVQEGWYSIQICPCQRLVESIPRRCQAFITQKLISKLLFC